MRLFSLPNGVVDRFDRAAWMTPPFDLALDMIVVVAYPTYVLADIRVLDARPDPAWTTVSPISTAPDPAWTAVRPS